MTNTTNTAAVETMRAALAAPAQPVTEPAQPATERYFTVVYKLTDANVAKYLSNRDWVTYVYADSMAELANLKELSAEPAAPTQPVAWQVNHIADHVADNWPMRKYDLAEIEQRLRGIPASPQPAAQAAPVDAAVQQDAERWQFLAEYLVSTRTDLDDEIVGCDSVQKMARVLDAAIAAQSGAVQFSKLFQWRGAEAAAAMARAHKG